MPSSLNVASFTMTLASLLYMQIHVEGLLNIHVCHYCKHGWFLITVQLHCVGLN